MRSTTCSHDDNISESKSSWTEKTLRVIIMITSLLNLGCAVADIIIRLLE